MKFYNEIYDFELSKEKSASLDTTEKLIEFFTENRDNNSGAADFEYFGTLEEAKDNALFNQFSCLQGANNLDVLRFVVTLEFDENDDLANEYFFYPRS